MTQSKISRRIARTTARILNWRSRYNRLERNERGEVRNNRRAKGSVEANRRKQEHRRARRRR